MNGDILVNFQALQDAYNDITRIRKNFENEMVSLTSLVEETTEHDWIGPDATLFVNNTKAKLKELHQKYDEFLYKLSAEIMTNSDKFQENQQRNISLQE